jgi:hypothetical protein
MTYRGVEYTVVLTATPGIWRWEFQIGDEIKTGKTATKLKLLAMRRAQLLINRELGKISRGVRPPQLAASFISETASPSPR